MSNQLAQAPHLLKSGTVLYNKYRIEKVIGQGGFGITYLGVDCSISQKVAIKEYYPNGFSRRNISDGMTVMPVHGDKSSFFQSGKSKFIDETRRLSRFSMFPEIVTAKDFFEENGTAYIIMEFIEGSTLKYTLAQMGGRMQETHILELMKPLMNSLSEIHKSGIIHRDIAPDNIMIQYPNGNVKLLDFGAAREIEFKGKSTIALAKHGYAPEEQYDSNRNRNGPWTDVYAICATIFHAIEGKPPPNAYNRLKKDDFKGFTISVSPSTKRAIEKGLAVRPQDRWQNISLLSTALYPRKPQKNLAKSMTANAPNQKTEPSILDKISTFLERLFK